MAPSRQEDEFMIRTKLFTACALAFVVSLAGTSAFAQEPTNQITYFTFSAPFELPGGKTLPAGKYVFKIVDSPGNRHIVHVMSEDQKEMHATLMAIPAQRMDPADEPEVRFMEAEANVPPAIRTWWYPGRSVGHEFIYPKDHARRLAARQSEGVLTVAEESANEEQMRTAELSRIGNDGREAAVNAEMKAETANAEAQARTAQTAPAARPEAETPEATAADRPAPAVTREQRVRPYGGCPRERIIGPHRVAAHGESAAALRAARTRIVGWRRRASPASLEI
jgi:hypothetical protein